MKPNLHLMDTCIEVLDERVNLGIMLWEILQYPDSDKILVDDKRCLSYFELKCRISDYIWGTVEYHEALDALHSLGYIDYFTRPSTQADAYIFILPKGDDVFHQYVKMGGLDERG